MFKSAVKWVALASAVALSTNAMADGPRRSLKDSGSAPFSWTGFYVGANAGYAWGESDVRSSAGCSDPAFPTCVYNDPADFAFLGGLASGNGKSDKFTGGVQAGYNMQFNNIIVGVEADFNSFKQESIVAGIGMPPNSATTAGVAAGLQTDWLATIRARLGMTLAPNLMAYVTGGLAVTRIEVANTFLDNASTLGFTDTVGASSESKTKAGWTVGGGLEWAMTNHWTLKGEYLYADFGSVSTSGNVTMPGQIVSANTLNSSADLTAHIARLGVNYKF